ncbi:tetratricopeptide repeat protein [Dactylosporangium cerinum]|uniref:Tetratricopeptide repeat protein n=1 Tax=Dactylosporangium cerinum TaxID=1434730 RepID=A0ABV9W9P4_9ACTN
MTLDDASGAIEVCVSGLAELESQPSENSELAVVKLRLELVTAYTAAGRLADALSCAERAVATWNARHLSAESDLDIELLRLLVHAHDLVPKLRRSLGQYDRADDALAVSVEFLRLVTVHHPSFAAALAAALPPFGEMLAGAERFAEAVAAYEEALAIYRQLSRDGRDNFFRERADLLAAMARLHTVTGQVAAAEACARDAIDFYERFATEQPTLAATVAEQITAMRSRLVPDVTPPHSDQAAPSGQRNSGNYLTLRITPRTADTARVRKTKLKHWPGMKVTWFGGGAVVHSGDEPSPGAAALVVSPHRATECVVVISSHTVKVQSAMVEELAEVLAKGLPSGYTAMRFVAWDGACATNERPAAAHLISMRLGIDVIAAAGPLLGVPGGSLFAPIGRGERRPGGFWRFRAGAQPTRVGWRFPAPQWEADLSQVPEQTGDLVLDQIPAGLWLHRRRPGSVTDLAYSVPTDDSHPAIILSHPSEEPLHRDGLVRALLVIPAPVLDRCVFTPYGQRPLRDGPVGPVVADVLGRAVHVRTGLPLCAPAGQRAVVTIDQKGLPCWRTFARELWHAPRTGAPRPVDWVNPCPDVLDTPAGAATFTLGSGWVLEVIQAGLWIRPEHLTNPADWIRGLPVDVNRCAVIIGAPHAAMPVAPGRTIAVVLEKLPVDARKRAYLAVPRGAGTDAFILADALRDSLPEPSEVQLVQLVNPLPGGTWLDFPAESSSMAPVQGGAARSASRADNPETLDSYTRLLDGIRRAKEWDESSPDS